MALFLTVAAWIVGYLCLSGFIAGAAVAIGDWHNPTNKETECFMTALLFWPFLIWFYLFVGCGYLGYRLRQWFLYERKPKVTLKAKL